MDKKVLSALSELGLDEIPFSAWDGYLAAEREESTDVLLSFDPIQADTLEALATGLKSIATENTGSKVDAFWKYMARKDDDGGMDDRDNLPRHRALLAVLAHIVLNETGDLFTAAMHAYIRLIQVRVLRACVLPTSSSHATILSCSFPSQLSVRSPFVPYLQGS